MIETLEASVKALGLSLSASQLQQFEHYQQFLLAWNEKINLTSIRDVESIQLRHFADSLSCAQVTGSLEGLSLVDVGSGGGFPGVPLKILFPSLRLTLIESINKKARFLGELAEELGLLDVNVLPDRVEDVARRPEHRERYDWAVARAVAHLRVLAEYLLPLCRVGGKMLAQKGPQVESEVEAATRAFLELGGGKAVVRSLRVPGLPNDTTLVVVQKLRATPAGYPRGVGTPVKNPI